LLSKRPKLFLRLRLPEVKNFSSFIGSGFKLDPVLF